MDEAWLRKSWKSVSGKIQLSSPGLTWALGHLEIEEQERYILEQLDPVIQRMVHAVLRKKPENLMVDHCLPLE